MTRLRQFHTCFACAILVVTCLALSACAENSSPDYCQDHYLFHQNHAGTMGLLTIKLSEDGRIASDLTLPADIFEDGERLVELDEYLRRADNIYSLNTERQCDAASSTVSANDRTIIASFESRCGEKNRIGQVDVLLFNSMPEIEEVEVLITTPATSKRFAISRQCSAAIFRLGQP